MISPILTFSLLKLTLTNLPILPNFNILEYTALFSSFLLSSTKLIHSVPSLEISIEYFNGEFPLLTISIADISFSLLKSKVTDFSSSCSGIQRVFSFPSLKLFASELFEVTSTLVSSFIARFSGIANTFNSAAEANPPTPSKATSLTWVAFVLLNFNVFKLPLSSQFPSDIFLKLFPSSLTWSSYLVIFPFLAPLLGK